MKVLLFQPQIPQNTGNVVRTCSVTGSSLILVRPLGFSTKNRWLKRAGLDYWEGVQVEEIDSLEEYLSRQTSFFFFSSKSKKLYTEAPYQRDSLLVFGSETTGLPAALREKWPERFYTIPMLQGTRCLNLATSAAIVLYEGLRQTQFEDLKREEESKENTMLMTPEVARGI